MPFLRRMALRQGVRTVRTQEQVRVDCKNKPTEKPEMVEVNNMDEQKEYEEAVDAISGAFARLVAIVFKGSATRHEAVRKVELVLAAVHGSLVECAVEATMKMKGE